MLDPASILVGILLIRLPSFLPPVNRYLTKITTAKEFKVAFDVLKILEDGNLTPDEVKQFLNSFVDKTAKK